MVLAIDPGPERSALVLYSPTLGLVEHYVAANDWVNSYLHIYHAVDGDVLVVERIASMGMAVGAEVHETTFWSGRFVQTWRLRGRPCARIKRVDIKLALCGQTRAKGANVRQVLIDRFGGPAAVKKGGALYKVAGDAWSALAVAVAYTDPALAPEAIHETV